MSSPSPEVRIKELGLELPAMRGAAGPFVHAVRTGNLLFLGGHLPVRPDGSIVLGKLGADLDAEAGYEAARLAALDALATIRHELGSLDEVQQLVRLHGVVNATPDFTQHTRVINGASELLVDVFGEAGRHARLAIGMSSLPLNMALEIEMVLEVRA